MVFSKISLKKDIFKVTPNWTLETAFEAKAGGTEGPCVAIICEYNALPVVGQRCNFVLLP